MLKHKLFTLFLLVSTGFGAWAQSSLKGVVQDAVTLKGIEGALVRLEKTKVSDETGEDGSFNLTKIPKKGNYTLIVVLDGYNPVEQTVQIGKATAKGLVISMRKIEADAPSGSDDLPTVTLDEADSETQGNNDVSSALGASRDIFLNGAGFNLFAFRFQPRGYDGENTLLFLNYIPMNDPETGFGTFSEFGGLNDVMRARDNSVGLEPTEYTFGGIGGSTIIDCRASRQRKQIRAGYANSNRQYDHRLMATYSTGLMANGWAVSASASRRWANEGYQPGTFFDGYSYFLSVDKKLGKKSMLDFTVLAAQSERGRATGSYYEMFDVAADKYYNPLWGLQQGKVRSASVSRQHQPIAIMRFDHDFSEKTKWITAVSVQTGPREFTGLDWSNAEDPRADYYKKIPSHHAQYGDAQEAQQAALLSGNEAERQIKWDQFYAINYANVDPEVLKYNPNAVGNRSLVILGNQRTDNTEANFNTIINHVVNDRFTVQGGGSYQYYVGQNYKVVEDLLGGDFFMNWDRYAQQDPDQQYNADFRQFDVLNPNRAVKVGERYDFDFDENIRTGSAWLQGQLVLSKVDLFASVTGGQTQFWREGKVKNGKFPDNSLGKGEVHTFPTYGVKAGLTYKISGAHYIYANGGVMERAPQFRNAYVSVRSRDSGVPNLTNEKLQTAEVGYLLRTPYWKGRLTGFYANIQDQALTRSFLSGNGFANSSVAGLDERHIGIEGGIEAKLTTSMTVSIAGSFGDYVYTSNPLQYTYEDNNGLALTPDGTPTFFKNKRTRGPQSAATMTIKYDLPKHTYVNITGNWSDKRWFDMLAFRHNAEAVARLEKNPSLRSAALEQGSAPAAYTLDFFGGKSWKFKRNFLYLNIGVSNILNNRYLLSGWESSWNPTKYPIDATTDASKLPQLGYLDKVTYANGITWFAGLSYKF